VQRESQVLNRVNSNSRNMIRSVLAVLVVIGSAHTLSAQRVASVTGAVRDTAGAPVAGAEVILSDQRTVTTLQGAFRFDSIPFGSHLITIRLIGYSPLRLPITVRGTSHIEYVLRRVAYVLPTVYVRARAAGIYGTVGDSGLTPLAGVIVQLAGKGGRQTITDSSGRFAFPLVAEGQYVVRAVHPGYAEEWLFLEVTKRDGVELAIRLRHSLEITSLAGENAVRDLSRRLVSNLPNDRLSAAQLSRFGSLSLCEVNKIAERIGRRTDSLAIILNGVSILEGRSLRDLCSWHAAEVQLVEFGDDICRDVTRTLVDLLNVWCVKFTGEKRFYSRIKTQRSGMPFVVIWESGYLRR